MACQSCSTPSCAGHELLPEPHIPVSLIQDDDFVAAWREGDLLLGKHLDLVAHYINAPASPTSSALSACFLAWQASMLGLNLLP